MYFFSQIIISKLFYMIRVLIIRISSSLLEKLTDSNHLIKVFHSIELEKGS